MVALTRTEDDWQQQTDELIALASILQGDFTLTDGPDVTGDPEQDTTALLEHNCCCEQLQCTVTVRADLPSDGINVKVYSLCYCLQQAGQADALRLVHEFSHWLNTSLCCLRLLASQSWMEHAGVYST